MAQETVRERFENWKKNIPESDPLYADLLGAENDGKEMTERFGREIAFGTAGLRGIYGAGTDRMNAYTVGRATQGIADYINASGEDAGRGVVLCYDCRYHSDEFAREAAEIFAANGIPSHIFPALRATPELSFAIRRLGALSGINMTASHNPKEYNGYKVYWSDGAQISGEVADGMTAAIGRLGFFEGIRRMPFAEGVSAGFIHVLDEGIDRQYLDYVLSLAVRPDSDLDKTVRLVYTPLNGAGNDPVREVFRARGFVNTAYVEEQAMPDPEFTTVGYPNPEDPKAFALAEKLGKETGAEVLIATDPDADRMAIEVREEDGSYRFLNGNQTGALLIHYMAEGMTAYERMPEKPAMVKSIVTGNLGKKICESYGVRVVEALTGFKNICGRIPGLMEEGYTCFFAYEESIGCAPNAEVRDKDGIAAGMLIAEMAAFYRKKGMTLTDALEAIYEKYGAYAEDQVSLVLKGTEGQERIARIMEHFRGRYGWVNNVEETENGVTVTWDFVGGEGLFALGLVKAIDYAEGWEDIPASNVLKFIMADGSWFAMRPSGTEPKLKFYYYAVRESMEEAAQRVEEMKAAVSEETAGIG